MEGVAAQVYGCQQTTVGESLLRDSTQVLAVPVVAYLRAMLKDSMHERTSLCGDPTPAC
jgi:hypothetical protein